MIRVSAPDGGSAISKARDRAAALRARSEALLDKAEMQIELLQYLLAQLMTLRHQANALRRMPVSRRAFARSPSDSNSNSGNVCAWLKAARS